MRVMKNAYTNLVGRAEQKTPDGGIKMKMRR